MDMNDKIVIYRTADGQTTVDVRMDGDTVWLSQAQMAELFQKDRTVIGRHITTYIRNMNWSVRPHVQNLHIRVKMLTKPIKQPFTIQTARNV